MRILTGQATARLRQTSEDNMTASAVIERQGAFVGTGGGAGHYPDAADLSVPCRLSPLGNTQLESEIAAQHQGQMMTKMVYSISADVRPSDRPKIAGVQYEVVSILPAHTTAIERHAVLRRA